MNIIILIISLLIMVLGLTLTLLPVFPGIIFVFGGSLLYAFYTHFEKITWLYLLIFGLLTILAFIVDFLSGILGAKKYGASRAGIYGGIVGVFIAIPFGPIGIIFIPVVSTIIAELLFDQNLKRSLRAGWGSFLGYLAGTFGKFALGLAIIIIFLIKVL